MIILSWSNEMPDECDTFLVVISWGFSVGNADDIWLFQIAEGRLEGSVKISPALLRSHDLNVQNPSFSFGVMGICAVVGTVNTGIVGMGQGDSDSGDILAGDFHVDLLTENVGWVWPTCCASEADVLDLICHFFAIIYDYTTAAALQIKTVSEK